MEYKKRTLVERTELIIVVVALFLLAATGIRLRSFNKKAKPVAGPILDNEEAYHVIVVGGEPEGIAAALAAARNGVKVLLVDENDALGGLMTLGMLNFIDQNHDPNGVLLTQGIFLEFFTAMGNAFDVEEAKTWFMNSCKNEPNLTVMLNTEIVEPVMEGNTIAGIIVRTKGDNEIQTLRALAVIDATVDGDVAAAAGAPYTMGGEDYGAYGTMQGVTLIFEVAGVDWDTVVNYMKNDGNPDTDATDKAAYGYGAQALEYATVDGNMRLRGPNIAKQNNGNVLLNALIVFGVDALDPVSYTNGIERGAQEIGHVIEFMRNNFVGFENASFVRHASRLYVRETRHFQGEYRLTITDVLENRDHWDRIAHGSYPVDLQPTNPSNFGNIIGVPDIYSIPFRCLIPLEIDQLLIAGRSASYDSIPHGSARVIPVGMATGEACGTAVAYSVENGLTFREMAYDPEAISWLQNKLRSQGAYLVEYEPPRMAVMNHWAYPGLAVMRELGLAGGGYTNDYKLDNEVPNRWMLQNRMNTVMRLAHERTSDRGKGQIPYVETTLFVDEVTLGQLFLTAARCASLGEPFSEPLDAKRYLIELGIIDESVLTYFENMDAIATTGQVIYILGFVYTYLMEA